MLPHRLLLDQQQQLQQQENHPTLLHTRGPEATQLLLQHKGAAAAAAAAAAADANLKWWGEPQHQHQQRLKQQQQQQQRTVLSAAAATAAPAAAAPAFSASEQQILREAFAVFDRDSDGLLKPAEFRAACTALGISTPQPMAEKMLVLGGRGGGVSFSEFCNFARTTFSLEETDEDVAALFDLFDCNRKGFLTLEDLQQAAACCGSEDVFSVSQLELMVAHLSPDGSGRIFLPQFKKLFRAKQQLGQKK